MLLKVQVLLFAVLISASCHYHSKEMTTDAPLPDTLQVTKEASPDDILMKTVDSLVDKINHTTYSTAHAYFPSENGIDSISTILYFKDSIPGRFEYINPGADTVKLYFTEEFPAIIVDKHDTTTYYQGFNRYMGYFRFVKRPAGLHLHHGPSKQSDLLDLYKVRAAKRAHDLTQLFTAFHLNIPNPVVDSFILTTFTSISMYAQPDSNSQKIVEIPGIQQVAYVQAANERGYYQGKEWLWYKVKYQGYTGWIVGHPYFVDEDSEDE